MSAPSPVQISVIVPTRDRPDSLRRTLDCLAPGTQTLAATKYEVVVTDDAKPPSAAGSIAQSHPWARVVEGPARGPAANRNNGARAATGDWIAFTDDDCEPAAEWLAAFARAAAEAAAFDILEGRTICRAGTHSPLDHAPVNDRGGKLWSCNLAVRSAAFRRSGGFDERFPHAHMEDTEFRERTRELGLRSQFVPDAVVDHPPRRLAFGGALGDSHYGDVLFAHLRRQPLSLPGLLVRIVRARVRATIAHGGADLGSAMASLLGECVRVVRCWGVWQRRAAAATSA